MSPTIRFVHARFLATLALVLGVAGCDAGRAPPAGAAPAADPAPAAPAADSASAAPEPATADSDATPPAADPREVVPPPGAPIDPVPPADPGEDLPTLTTGDSSADNTWVGEGAPVQTALRVGERPGADRLVFEFSGDGLPQWSIAYVDRPVYDCGSGDALRLPGDAWLQVRFSGAQAHTEAGVGTTGPRLRTIDQPNLIALARTCDFEGEVTWVAAVRSPKGYTPRVLAGPSRLVVDIAH